MSPRVKLFNGVRLALVLGARPGEAIGRPNPRAELVHERMVALPATLQEEGSYEVGGWALVVENALRLTHTEALTMEGASVQAFEHRGLAAGDRRPTRESEGAHGRAQSCTNTWPA